MSKIESVNQYNSINSALQEVYQINEGLGIKNFLLQNRERINRAVQSIWGQLQSKKQSYADYINKNPELKEELDQIIAELKSGGNSFNTEAFTKLCEFAKKLPKYSNINDFGVSEEEAKEVLKGVTDGTKVEEGYITEVDMGVSAEEFGIMIICFAIACVIAFLVIAIVTGGFSTIHMPMFLGTVSGPTEVVGLVTDSNWMSFTFFGILMKFIPYIAIVSILLIIFYSGEA